MPLKYLMSLLKSFIFHPFASIERKARVERSPQPSPRLRRAGIRGVYPVEGLHRPERWSGFHKKSIVFLSLLTSISSSGWPFKPTSPEKTVIILDAAGAPHPGRSLYDNFEATLTYALTQELKSALNILIPQAKIIMNRSPSDMVAPLQNATFANRVDPFLYISIHACALPTATKSAFYLYNFSYNDPVIAKNDTLSFYTLDTVYVVNKHKTMQISQSLAHALTQYQNIFAVHGPYQCPFKPLIGIKPPALAIEICLTPHDTWQDLVQPLARSIAHIITSEHR